MTSGKSFVFRTLPGARAFLLVLFGLLISSVTAAAVTPVKSPNDSNDYRYLTLENGLRVLLVSSPDSDKAAASLNITVGSGDDPKGREGMAHFLEHMLFLGTEKYPEPGEYQQFIKSHGGSHNAFTAFQDTNYFFDVQAEFLEEALDRFAEQFASPLFTADLVDRERKAVHSEFSSLQKEDGRRYYSVQKAIANPEHAFHQFAVGNLSTLENTEERPLRPDLIDFWKARYSSNLMTVAVYGPQSLDELEAMVRPRFGAIENRELEELAHKEPLYTPEMLPGRLQMATLKDKRVLSLLFPIPSQEDQYRVKPVSYVANLLGHEGPGSLFDRLKSAGLVEGLSAGTGMDTGHASSVAIQMSLTPKGLANQAEILSLTFAYIDKIREQGISRRFYEESKQLSQIDFRFREKPSPTSLVTSLSMLMPNVAPEDVLQAPWMMETYAPDKYLDILNRLTPDNVLVSVQSPDPDFNAPKETQWYGAKYELAAVEASDLRQQTSMLDPKSLALPAENPFIPDDLSMISGDTMDQPALLGAVGGMDLWYARDTRFGTPKANIYLSLRTPATSASARSSVLSSLMVDAVNTNLNAWAYPAQLAGLDYKVYTHLRGVTVRVGGYSDKIYTLLSRILRQLANPYITEQRFNISRERLIDNLMNSEKDRPVSQTSQFIQTALIEGVWSNEEKLIAARSVTLDELKSFADAFLAQIDPVMLAHGNITPASTLNLAQRINASMLKTSERVAVERSRVRSLPDGQTKAGIEVDHPDNGYTLYVQGDNTGFEERARYRLLGQIIASPFYEELRTTRQLGYIVYATSYEILEAPAVGFVVQSPSANAEEIDQAVSSFAQTFLETLAGMTDEELNREKRAVISKLMERDRRLGEISERYWQEIDRGQESFDSREQLAAAVESVTLEQLKEVVSSKLINRDHAFQVVSQNQPDEAQAVLEKLYQRPFVSAPEG